MKNKLNLIITFIFIFLTSSCGGSNNDNFDFSNIKMPVKELKKVETKSSQTEVRKPVKYKLKALKERDEILSSIEFGRKDPFSISSESSSTLSKVKLKGLISISDKNYAMVKYLDNEGSISIESVGGMNTNLLPEGAKIYEIKPKKGYLKITHEGEIFTLNLDDN